MTSFFLKNWSVIALQCHIFLLRDSVDQLCCAMLSCSVVSDSLPPHDCMAHQAPCLCRWGFSSYLPPSICMNMEWVAMPASGGIFLTGESHRGPPALQVNSFPAELPGMPGNQLFVHIHLLPLEPACPPMPALWSSQSTELSPLRCPVASHS